MDKKINKGTKKLNISKESLDEILVKLKRLEEKNDETFKETLKSLKHIFRSKNLVSPKNWQEIFNEWFYENYPDILYTTHNEDFYTLIGDRKIILEWAEEYTESITVQKEDILIKENGESFAVRYELIELLFNENQEFKSLGEKKKEQIYKYILGITGSNGIRTARGIKNKDSKYRTHKHKERAQELLDKIKKGIIL